MARTIQDNGAKAADQTDDKLTFQANGTERIDLPSSDLIADAQMTREGDDLVLETPNGEVAVIEGYFSADPAPRPTFPRWRGADTQSCAGLRPFASRICRQ